MELTEKTTIAEILQTDLFADFLQTQLNIYKMYGANIDARAKSLRELVEAPYYNVEGITCKYAECLDKTCKLSKLSRDIIVIMGNAAFCKTVEQMLDAKETKITYSDE